jgi:hypothetical protein
MRKIFNTFGRALGALCGAVLAVVWAFTLWVPAAGLHLAGVSVVVALMLTVFGLFAVIAAVRGHATVVVLLFLASFFPIGASLVRVDHWLHWVGWLDVGLLVAAVPMWLTREPARAAPEAVD